MLCLIPVLALAAPQSASDRAEPAYRTSITQRPGGTQLALGTQRATEPTPEMAALQAELKTVIATGDVDRIKAVENRVQALILSTQAPQDVRVTAEPVLEPPQGMTGLGTDVTIAGGTVNGTAADYTMDGKMYAAAGLPDSTVRVWRSTDFGATWGYLCGVSPSPHALYPRISLVVGTGDSNQIFIFLIHPIDNGDVYQARFDTNGANLQWRPVQTGPDTITDIAFCRDFYHYYYVYGTACNSANPMALNTSILRTVDYGMTWAKTDSWGYCAQPSYQSGAGTWEYYAAQIPNTPGSIAVLFNTNYGDPSFWRETDLYPDAYTIEEPVVTPAFTTPETSATTWLAYHHYNASGNPFSIMTAYSLDGGVSFSTPAAIASDSGAGDVWPDLKSYHSVGNTYINLSYISLYNNYRRVFRRFAEASTPGVWSDTLRINSDQALRLHEEKPLLVYAPGAPGSGAGCVFVHFTAPGDFVWNSPWNTSGVADSPRPAPTAGFALKPNPAVRAASFTWGGTALRAAVYDLNGKLVRRFDRPAGNSLVWDLTDARGRAVSRGVYLVRMTTRQGTNAQTLVVR